MDIKWRYQQHPSMGITTWDAQVGELKANITIFHNEEYDTPYELSLMIYTGIRETLKIEYEKSRRYMYYNLAHIDAALLKNFAEKQLGRLQK